MTEPSQPLLQPEPSFAAEWCVEDPLAQGALKHACITVLDAIEEARVEAASSSPDTGDLGPLGIFPRGVRPALTPLLVDKIYTAAIIVGWKLAQPGDPIAPGCPAEELALELIRQQAILTLELVDAPSASLGATKGVYEVCEDDDILDLFAMQEPADAALALTNPISAMMGEADMRIEEWFHPFYDGGPGFAPHPLYNERSAKPTEPVAPRNPIEVIAAEPSPDIQVQAVADDLRFRVCIRVWEDDFLDRPETNWMPDRWVYYPEASTADQARAAALELFPHGASEQPAFDDIEEVLLRKEDISRISIDIQRVHLSQDLKATASSAFHIVGTLAAIPDEHLPHLAAHLEATFSAVVVARDNESKYFAVNVNAESHEEAESDLDDAFSLFSSAVGIEDYLIGGCTCGAGARDTSELMTEIQQYRPLG
jgi:hypothetical protein